MEGTVAPVHQEAVQGLHLLIMVPENHFHTDEEQVFQLPIPTTSKQGGEDRYWTPEQSIKGKHQKTVVEQRRGTFEIISDNRSNS